jgi:predicted TIM-barrel fold metal-dependent hydrolase
MRQYDTFEIKAFSGKPIDNCMVVDAHGHIGECCHFPLYDASLESIIETMDRIGIDIFCASPHLVLSPYAKEGNDILIEAIRQYPKRIFGYMTANIGCSDSVLPELERCFNAGLRAVKIHSHNVPYSHPNYDILYQFANSNHLPILAHTWGSELKDIEKNFNKYKKINFILAHAGATDKENYARVSKEYHNVYLETCFSQCPRGLIEYFVKSELSDKILWGSDMTFMSAEHQVGRVIFADISETDKIKILGLNAINVLKIECPPK